MCAPLVNSLVIIPPIVAAAVLAAAACGGAGDNGESIGVQGRPAIHVLASRASPFDVGCAGDLDSLITPAGIGPVRIWMSASRLRFGCAARDTSLPALGGSGYTALVVRAAAGEVIAVARSGQSPIVERVVTANPRFLTRTGIGVGSMLRDINRAHPRTCVISGAEAEVVAIDGLPGVTLTLGRPLSDMRDSVTHGGLRRIPDTARVTLVTLDGLAPKCGPG